MESQLASTLIGRGAGILLGSVGTAVVARRATKLLFGFTPSFGMVYRTALLSSTLGYVLSFIIVSLGFGARLQLILCFAVGLVIAAVTFGYMLRDPDNVPIGILKGSAVVLTCLTTALFVFSLFALASSYADGNPILSDPFLAMAVVLCAALLSLWVMLAGRHPKNEGVHRKQKAGKAITLKQANREPRPIHYEALPVEGDRNGGAEATPNFTTWPARFSLIALAFSLLAVGVSAYGYFNDGSRYYLETLSNGSIYKIDKRTGKVWRIVGDDAREVSNLPRR